MRTIITILLLSHTTLYSQSIDVDRINYLHHSAAQSWTKSSQLAYPFFDSLTNVLLPIYNKYNLYDLEISSAINHDSRNTIRFMYEYFMKFNKYNGLETGWKLSQNMKCYSAIKAYNNMIFEKKISKDSPIIERIKNTENIFDIEQLNKLNNDLKTSNKSDNLFVAPPTLKELQNKLLPNEIYLSFSFSLNERSFYILRLTKNSQKVIKSSITSFELINRIALLKGIMENNNELISISNLNMSTYYTLKNKSHLNFEKDLASNLKVLEGELVNKLDIDKNSKIIIENDIFIYQIPFDLLKNVKTNRLLVQDNEISYVPNAEYFIKLRSKAKLTQYKSVLGISSTNDNTNASFENEINILSNYFKSPNLILAKNVDKNTFLDYLRNKSIFDIIHLSTHFRKDVEIIDKNQEIQNDEFELDGFKYFPINNPKGKYYFDLKGSKLYPEEILDKNNVSTNLLILSGCESGTGDDLFSIIKPIAIGHKMNDSISGLKIIESNGKKTINLGTIKILANGQCYCNSTESFTNLSLASLPFSSKYVIAFQNKVSIESSEQFFRQFYEYLAIYKDIHKAFRKTKIDFLNRLDSKIYDHFSIILIAD